MLQSSLKTLLLAHNELLKNLDPTDSHRFVAAKSDRALSSSMKSSQILPTQTKETVKVFFDRCRTIDDRFSEKSDSSKDDSISQLDDIRLPFFGKRVRSYSSLANVDLANTWVHYDENYQSKTAYRCFGVCRYCQSNELDEGVKKRTQPNTNKKKALRI